MNKRIFDNVNSYNKYIYNFPIRNNANISTQNYSPDLILNRNIAEMKKENPQEKENLLKERIKEVFKYLFRKRN